MAQKIKFYMLKDEWQKLIIESELSHAADGQEPRAELWTIEQSPYENDPDGQLLTVDTDCGQWLMVWDSKEVEFTTLMKANQK